ncbi:class F sortase [Arthrobacter sp. PsM3]|uniref:class F sortase n=1 Tax=Arthrobacter sp. PsM3 TaxID=3030531 RepID=UPI00263AAA01|nr:class F sortase [Arthrobacter sp. PsM3]MDN4643069.1 class F sortase [Arthrobacter sp. PsM3]
MASVRRRPRTRMIFGGALVAAALAAVVGLSAAPGSPPPAAGPGQVTPAPTDAPASATVSTPAPHGSLPLHITYPAIGMDQDVLPLTPQDQGPGATIVPPMTAEAYWLTPYGSPGSTDTTYIIGHSWEGRDSAFNHLSSQAKPGNQFTVTTATGPATYTVKTIATEDKNTLKDSPIWDRVPNRLVLVSCYTADLRGTNIVITADLEPVP